MSRDLDQLLQECLSGLDAGLTPEECLSAWPQSRDQLEPMLRQALLLRMAFAASPREEFRQRARQKLMFAAGREARQAFSSQPDERFVQRARERFLSAAGASAQESLRNVPPPRLAFWINARRRLLEAASRRPVVPAPRPMALAFRTSLSAAIVVLAMAVAGLAYFAAQPAGTSVSAQFAALEQQVGQLEELAASGEAVPATALVDTSRASAALAEKVSESSQASLAQGLTDLIERQQALKDRVETNAPEPPPALKEVGQLLNQAQVKIQAARADTPTSLLSQPTAATTGTVSPAATDTQPSPTVAASAQASATSTPAPLGPNDIARRRLPDDRTHDIDWVELSTLQFRITIPASWQIAGISFDSNGIGHLESPNVVVLAPKNTTIVINVNSGSIVALINGVQETLRATTASGAATMNVEDLLRKAEPVALELSYMLQSVAHAAPAPTPTPSPTASPTATETPTVTPSPPPSATPSP